MSVRPNHTTASDRRRTPRRVALLGVLLVAAGLIVWGDWQLRGRQHLVEAVLANDTPVIVPFTEFLHERALRRVEWSQLNDRLAQARAAGFREAFVKTAYEATQFASTHMTPDDPRRREVLLEVVARHGDHGDATRAYLELFDPAWRRSLRDSYPRYTTKVMAISDAEGDAGLGTLASLAGLLREIGQTDLERQALLHMRERHLLGIATAPMMRRLVEVLPPGDDRRTTLENELGAHQRRIDALLARAKWYEEFEKARAAGNLTDAERLRREADADDGAVDAYLASADAHLVDTYLLDGRFADADALRRRIAGYTLTDLEDSMRLGEVVMPTLGMMGAGSNPATRASAAATGGAILAPINDPSRPMVMLPDVYRIGLHAWRGLLASGRFDDAARAAAKLFVDDAAPLLKHATEETALVRGDWAPLMPVATLQLTTTGLPTQLAGAARAWHATLDLTPTGKAVPAEIKTRAEVWVSSDKVVVEFHADEPRSPQPQPAPDRKRDGEVWKDECVELFFDPDRWSDFYYQVACNNSAQLHDARHVNVAGGPKPVYTPQPAINTGVTSEVGQTPTGWRAVLTLPRRHVFPDGQRAVRFNARRFRYVTENKQQVLQSYSWAPVADASHRPAMWGWLVMPSEASHGGN